MFLEIEKERWIDLIRMWMNEHLGGAKKGTILQSSPDSIVLYMVEDSQTILK